MNQIVNLFNINENIKQIILVLTTPESHTGYLYTFEKTGAWTQVLNYIPVVCGKAGITTYKIEGDCKTPLGLFNIGHAFGATLKPQDIKIPYRQITQDDKFIDDPESDQYNTWVVGNTDAKSYETMKRLDNQYDLGLVIEYNMHPVVTEKGSAIFMHIWENNKKGTAGCVAMDKNNLLDIIGWLDPTKSPHLYILAS
jgi:L,D-peptidoglycan transpeptidase YkuD (ErfK/YbiS/YcfS/YnhG family)